MSDQYFDNQIKTSDILEETDIDTIVPVVASDPFADRDPVDPDLIVETPMGGTVASAGPLNGPIPDEIPMFETPDQEIPMGGTVAPVGPMDETIPPVTSVVEAPATELGVSETLPYVHYVDPMDQKLSQDVPPVNMVVEPSESSVGATVYSDESENLLTTMNENLGKLTD
jgi:hypothetical protein